MNSAYENIYHRLEDENWWFKARQDFFRRYIMAYASPEARVLDIGCGGGGLLESLNSHGIKHTYGIDISLDAVSFCEKRGLKNISVGDAQQRLAFEDNTFDIIISSDVLEHLKRPLDALTEWKRLLKPHGTLLIFVPAFPFLWSSHDEVNHHQMRYTQSSLFTQTQAAGLTSVMHSYWNAIFFLPYIPLLKFNGEKLFHIEHDSVVNRYGIINKILTYVMYIENFLILHKFRFPFGVSFFAAFRKV